MKIIKLIGLVILIWMGYTAYLWIVSVKEIECVCGQIQAGQSIQEVKDRIQAGKYLLHFENKSKPNEVCGITIYSRECNGKYTCCVELDNGMVIGSDFKGS